MNKISVETIEYAFNVYELDLIKSCLDYCSHRIRKHDNTSIERVVDLDDLDKVRQDIRQAIESG